MTGDVRPASEAEKARLNETFAALCRIPSPFGHEAAIAARVTRELEAMGLSRARPTSTGNLLARITRAAASARCCSAPTWTRSR